MSVAYRIEAVPSAASESIDKLSVVLVPRTASYVTSFLSCDELEAGRAPRGSPRRRRRRRGSY
jgi:hypothetical protein